MESEIPKAGYVENCKAIQKHTAKAQLAKAEPIIRKQERGRILQKVAKTLLEWGIKVKRNQVWVKLDREDLEQALWKGEK